MNLNVPVCYADKYYVDANFYGLFVLFFKIVSSKSSNGFFGLFFNFSSNLASSISETSSTTSNTCSTATT